MEEEDTKLCTNCKREIPAVNFTIHSVHCARNIRSCPVCKEPVPVAQLKEHHDALHKEVPCKKCGESVCGTDLEDHVRDSCAQTIKPCRYCELELPRRDLPSHEAYCGARSEQCPDCREYVMAKYKQLHLDSNHGFIRLDDDPTPKEEKPKMVLRPASKPITNGIPSPSTSNGLTSNLRPATDIRHNEAQSSRELDKTRNGVTNNPRALTDMLGNQAQGSREVDRPRNGVTNNPRPLTDMRGNQAERPRELGVSNGLPGVPRSMNDIMSYEAQRSREVDRERKKVTVKRTNDQPQINTNVLPAEKITKEMPSRGAVKKRPAPPPPPNATRDRAYHSAAARAQREEKERQEQSAYNLSVGLPPVLSPAAKLDKLRKMDALHNREAEEVDYRSKLQGRVWMPPDVPVGNILGSDGVTDLSNLQPMTAVQFMNRFQELQLGAEQRRPANARPAGSPRAPPAAGDRFSEIKSSLRELRRGLNEVTAPYNATNTDTRNNTQNAHNTQHGEVRARAPSPAGDTLRLPCEFCGRLVPADDLVLHQTGCRPDLTQYRAPARQSSPPVRYPLEPVIPCEFCPESLPVYLINEHQERCRREANTCRDC